MSRHRFRLVNVFGIHGDPFSGNPLCVFEDGTSLSDAAMQALARQFNLSETTFVLPSTTADARVRIFTPSFEMPFAGHPTLGSAHVVRSLKPATGALQLELAAGVITVNAHAGSYTLQAKAPATRKVSATRAQLAQMLGIDEGAIAGEPLWVDTGSEQLVVPLANAAAVERCQPEAKLLEAYGKVRADRYLVYVFAEGADERITTRFFFNRATSVVEDPATGSACANLGGYLLATGSAVPLTRRISQGHAVQRPSELELHVDSDRRILVTGAVIDVGHGEIELPD